MKKTNKTGKISYIFTKETFGMTLMLFSAIVLLMLITRDWIFAGLGREICSFMYGTFGYGSLFLTAYLEYLGFRITFEKKLNINKKYILLATAIFASLFLLFHSVTTRDISLDSFGGYLFNCYAGAREGWSGYTFGGSLCGLIVYPVARLTTFIGAYVIFSALLVLCGYFVFIAIRHRMPAKPTAKKETAITVPVDDEKSYAEQTAEEDNAAHGEVYATDVRTDEGTRRATVVPAQDTAENPAEEEGDKYSRKKLGRKILFENGEFDAESYKRNMIFSDDSYFNHPADGVESYLSNFKNNSGEPQGNEASYTQSYQNEVEERKENAAPSNYVYGEKPVENLGEYSKPEETAQQDNSFETYGRIRNADLPEEPRGEERTDEVYAPEPETRRTENVDFMRGENIARPRETENADVSPRVQPEPARGESIPAESRRPDGDEKPRSILSSLFGSDARRAERAEDNHVNDGGDYDPKMNIFDDDNSSADDVFGSSRADNPVRGAEESPRGLRTGFGEDDLAPRRERDFGGTDRRNLSFQPKENAEKPEPPKEEKPKHVWKKYVAPSLDLLDDYPENNNVNTGEIEENKRIIVDTLEKFKITSEVANVTVGPAITRYDVIIEDRTNIKRSLGYRDEIALALMKNNVNVYLNYAKGALSIEIPNNRRTIVGLKTMLASSKFINCKPNSLTFGLGKDVDGEVVCPNITKMPHLLVAGTTGSGKSICLNALLVSLLFKYGPEELRLILVDPKQAEFIPFARLPHLMINEILYDIDKVIKALNWAIKEMERRYTLFKEMTENGVATKNLDEYNEHLPEGEEKLPKILIVLDEFGDLMMQAKKEIEFKIIRLAQKARACGIHLILATQRPSVDCITGLIKSNLPSRIGFKVNSFDDSRTIFDIGGAEKLLGMGDMYFRSPDKPELERIQGCFIDSHEVQKVTDFVKAHNETYFDQEASDFINKVEEPEVQQTLGDAGEEGGDGKMDDTYLKALKYCVASNQASVSMIQRRFPVGYIKACKIIDWMAKMNYITQSEGSKPRKVLMTMDEFTNTYGEVDD